VCFNNQLADIGMPISANDLGNLGNAADIGKHAFLKQSTDISKLNNVVLVLI